MKKKVLPKWLEEENEVFVMRSTQDTGGDHVHSHGWF